MDDFFTSLLNAPWQDSGFDFIIFFTALFLSGFFSGAETALTALPETKVHQLIATKTRKNKLLKYWVKHPNQILTTVLIGNNVVNAFTAALATLIAQELFSNQAVSVAVGFTTVATLIVGEITPKTYAKHNAEQVAPLSLVFLVPLYYILYPAIWIFSKMSYLIVQILGKELSKSGPFITQEDIEYYVQLGQKEGVLEEHEEELISSVLEFTDTVVREIMIPRTEIIGVAKEANLDEVIEEIIESGHSRLPVYDENIDHILGIFHGREILNLFHQDTEHFNLEQHTHEAIFIPQQMKLSALLNIFQKKKSHLAVVVDEYGGTAGIVTLEDVLEELVGEIQDEYDEENKEIHAISKDRYVILGKTHLSDIEETLDCEFPESANFESLAGFLIEESGKMPTIGDRIPYQSWLFIVTHADQRHVEKCEAIKIHKKESSKTITLPPVKEKTT